MGFLFGIGALVFAALFLLRLLPKLVGLGVLLGSAALTGTAALAVLYVLTQGR